MGKFKGRLGTLRHSTVDVRIFFITSHWYNIINIKKLKIYNSCNMGIIAEEN